MSRRTLKIAVFLAWLVLLGLLASRDLFVPVMDSGEEAVLRKARQEKYYGIWFNGQRIGYVVEIMRPRGEDFILDQEAHLLLNVLDTTQPVDMRVRATLSGSLRLLDFTFRFTSPFSTMEAEGTVEGTRVSFRLDTGQATIADTVSLPEPPLLAINDRGYLLDRLSGPGQKIRVPSFDPLSLSARESIITYHGQEKIVVRGRLQLLHRFSEALAGMRTSFWTDEAGKVIMEESPAGFKFIAEPEFRARDIVRPGTELLSAVAVPFTGDLPAPGAGDVTYRVTMPPDLDFELAGGRQTVEGDLLRVTLEQMPERTALAGSGNCGPGRYLEPSRYVQADNGEIIAQAAAIVGPETDPAVRVRLLARWVHANLEKRPVIGLPDALTTLKSRKGDCNEHASLFAALARSLGIPTAIATGVTLQHDAFYYHAWNEVCLGGQWYSLDTTTDQLPADLYHIRFARGDIEQQLMIGGLLGNLEIEIVSPPR
ncbi:MAG: transglutaminase-like domain-containing protein [Desulfobulbaceae bacterium]|jgi:transglutaminase-like putative cysteine protease|nr:transglutaminase-like domain-containing protein [Desulfobulbaceae bacterium]